MKYIMLLRLTLTLLLAYGVYTETGVWTALFSLLAMAAIEIQVKQIKDIDVSLCKLFRALTLRSFR